jgi:hypothetical protein
MLRKIYLKEKRIMAKIDEVRAALQASADAQGQAIGDISTKLDALIARVEKALGSPGGLSGAEADEVVASLKAQSDALAALASGVEAKEDAELPDQG